MAILSIQSHVAYGYVGNKAAVYPLQAMGYDVWPVNTVQFSNHTGYGHWEGEIFSKEHIHQVILGLETLNLIPSCQAILSGYMGSEAICHEVAETVKRFKAKNPALLYLCDPVIGNQHCFVKPEVLEFFKHHLVADIITPNQYEAETLSGIPIKTVADLKTTAQFFQDKGSQVVIITGVKLNDVAPDTLHIYGGEGNQHYLLAAKEYTFPVPPSGTGDLFSAVFLGSYLTYKNLDHALRRSVDLMNRVLAKTAASGGRELRVLDVDYKQDNTVAVNSIMI
ncbi:MAG: pyridoxal/pyridoxine/pyridoxamine kinase [Gammaproteobacteria bacterium]|jgi:pyridoxine kinase|nr:pyridoxal/pyridoxine/pyridoxamine kinase [Gammaproteobacteria bacterium]